jgi:hypothetical protein
MLATALRAPRLLRDVPNDEEPLAVSRALIAERDRKDVPLIARRAPAQHRLRDDPR